MSSYPRIPVVAKGKGIARQSKKPTRLILMACIQPLAIFGVTTLLSRDPLVYAGTTYPMHYSGSTTGGVGGVGGNGGATGGFSGNGGNGANAGAGGVGGVGGNGGATGGFSGNGGNGGNAGVGGVGGAGGNGSSGSTATGSSKNAVSPVLPTVLAKHSFDTAGGTVSANIGNMNNN